MFSPVILAIAGLLSAATAAPAPASLGVDDIIVIKTDGTSSVMKAAEFAALNNAAPAPAKPEFVDVASAPDALRRRCDESTEVQVLSDEEFLNWDIAISPVVSSVGGEARVTVAAGYSIANAVNVGASVSSSIMEGLGLALSVSYTETWTTTQDQSQMFTVPEGMHGVIVSQPYVRRVQGNVFSGCTDAWEKTPFTSDTYSNQSYGNLQWVKGLIRLCSSETYPIPYCIGEGEHK